MLDNWMYLVREVRAVKPRCSWSILLLLPIAGALFYGIFGFASFFSQGQAYPFSRECLIGVLALCGGFLLALIDEIAFVGILGGVFMIFAAVLAFTPFWLSPKWTTWWVDLLLWLVLCLAGCNLMRKKEGGWFAWLTRKGRAGKE